LRAGYTFTNGAGVRLQYWGMDTSYDVGHNGALTEISFAQTDLVGFRAFEATPMLEIEVYAGVRNLAYDDQNFGDSGQSTGFDGTGAVFGLSASQGVFEDGALFGNFETTTMFGDGDDNGTIEANVNRTQFAVGIGYEHSFDIGAGQANVRIGYEAHTWEGFEDNTDGAIGFNGFVIGGSYSF
jgi:hypothetical protein